MNDLIFYALISCILGNTVIASVFINSYYKNPQAPLSNALVAMMAACATSEIAALVLILKVYLGA